MKAVVVFSVLISGHCSDQSNTRSKSVIPYIFVVRIRMLEFNSTSFSFRLFSDWTLWFIWQ